MADYNKSSLPIETLNVPGVDSARVTVGVLDSTGAAINPAKEDGNLASILVDTTAIKNKDFATETTLATIKTDTASLAAEDFATETTLATIKTDTASLAAEDFATETTLATVKTDTGVIAGDTTSIDAKIPSQGQAVMASSMPVVIASDQSVLNVNVVSAVEANPITHYMTSSALAAGASVTTTYTATGNFVLDKVWASASGKMKVEVKAGATPGSTIYVGFNSTANPNIDIPCGGPKLVATDIVSVTFTNNDNQAMDVYATVSGQNV